MKRLLVFALTLVCTPLVLVVAPAAATCGGPRWDTESRTVRRGATITVTGEGWGTQCYDTGMPAGAHGVLGDPQINLTLTLVQESRYLEVAHGDAGADYSWTAHVAIPIDFAPGPAALEIFTPAPFFEYSRLVLEITDEPPISGGSTVADLKSVAFGTGGATSNEGADPTQNDSGQSRVGVIVVVVVGTSAALGAATLVAVRLRRRETHW